MKVEVIESKEKEEIPYPKLMESPKGAIVLMYKEGEGILLKSNPSSGFEIGEYICGLAMNCFTDFEGKLELTNK